MQPRMASSSKKRALRASAKRREEFANSQAGLNYGRSLLQAAGIDTSDFARLSQLRARGGQSWPVFVRSLVAERGRGARLREEGHTAGMLAKLELSVAQNLDKSRVALQVRRGRHGIVFRRDRKPLMYVFDTHAVTHGGTRRIDGDFLQPGRIGRSFG